MNTLKVYVKKNGVYTEIEGNVVNITTNELLDEQLDQARLVVINSPVDNYPPLTEFRIDFLSNNIVEKSVFYLSGESNTITILAPRNNERRYKIDVLLIERTKLLEGVLCQSLTFTNAKGKQWGEGDIENPVSALTFRSVDRSSVSLISEEYADQVFGVELYKTPLKVYTILEIRSPKFIETRLKSRIDPSNSEVEYVNLTYGIDSNLNTVTSSSTTDAPIKIELNGSIFSIKYSCKVREGIYESTFEYQYVIAGVENRYPLKPYTITDCICRCLELAQPLTLGELPKYKLQGVNYTLNADGTFTRSYEAGSQAEKYDKIIAPNFTMTQCTLREQLKVIGGFVHAEPRLGYKVDGTGLNYEENTIVFEEFEQEETTNLTDKGYIYRGVSQSLNNYCTSVTTNIANLVNTINYFDGVIQDPTSNAYKTLRTDNINVMLAESNSKIQTQFPIYDIIKVMCTVFNSDGSIGSEYDITPYVFEQHEYNNLSSYEGTYPYAKGYAIYYTQGQKGLDGLFFKNEGAQNIIFRNYAIKNIIDSVSGSDFDSENDWQKLGFRISYIPIYSTMFSHGKNLIQDGNNNFTIPYAQSENLTESTYYGEHLKGVANRVGNVEEVRTYIVPDITYLPKTGQKMKTEKGDMVIASVASDMRHTHFKVTVALTKDFIRLSQYVGVNSHKRVSEVSEREAYARDILIKEYAVIGDSQTSNAKFYGNDVKPLVTAITGSILKYNPISAAVCAGARKRYYKQTGSQSVDYLNGVSLPVVSSAFGNAMVFSWSYKDNYSAIESLQRFSYTDENDENQSGTYQRDIPYGDYYGRFYWYDFALVDELSPITNEQNFADGTTAQTGVIKYPDSGQLSAYIRSSQFNGKHNAVNVQKDSREALNVNYEIEFITNRPDLILGSAIASKCDLIGTDPSQYTAHVYFFKGYKFGKYPRSLAEVDMSKKVGEITQYITDDNKLVANDDNLFFDFSSIPEFDSWCIAYNYDTTQEIFSDENGDTVTQDVFTGGEITLACNNDSAYYESKNQTSEQIYITISDTNLKGV